MANQFKTVGLIGKPQHEATRDTVVALHAHLKNAGCGIIIEENVADYIDDESCQIENLVELGKVCDLAIVVGGDGYMLGAARVLSRYHIAVIGVNRGNLGFLTDLNPDDFDKALEQVLQGHYNTEMRYLLDVSVIRHQEVKSSNSAMNEVVLHADKVAHMIEFEAYIDGSFVFHQRADGLIVSTPTGSTAYSLSGGGPIVHPNLNAMTLVPMFPHSMTSRPLVVDADSELRLVLSKENRAQLQVSCDSHIALAVMPGDELVIKKHKQALRLIHPVDHDYYDVLRKKLHWGRQNF